jgi:2-methoxy-6-polyprenyl-1,4-benzoquinol methylase
MTSKKERLVGFKNIPVDEKEPLVGKVFQSVAPKYDVMNDFMSVGMHRLWKDHLVSTLSPAPGIKHLDVAGGTGDIAFRILKKLKQNGAYEGTVTVLDINQAMITEGKKKADQKQLSGVW